MQDKYEKENIRGSLDLLNLLYVAFTRAREALFVPVAVKKAIKAPETSENGLIKKISRASDAIGRHPLLAWFNEDRKRFSPRGELEHKEKKPQLVTRAAPVPAEENAHPLLAIQVPGLQEDRHEGTPRPPGSQARRSHA